MWNNELIKKNNTQITPNNNDNLFPFTCVLYFQLLNGEIQNMMGTHNILLHR